MNKTISLLRILILLAIGVFSFFYLLGEEMDENLTDWMLYLILDKALALLAIWVFVLLYKKWSLVDPWISAYDKYCKKGMDAPNPLRSKDNDYWE